MCAQLEHIQSPGQMYTHVCRHIGAHTLGLAISRVSFSIICFIDKLFHFPETSMLGGKTCLKLAHMHKSTQMSMNSHVPHVHAYTGD